VTESELRALESAVDLQLHLYKNSINVTNSPEYRIYEKALSRYNAALNVDRAQAVVQSAIPPVIQRLKARHLQLFPDAAEVTWYRWASRIYHLPDAELENEIMHLPPDDILSLMTPRDATQRNMDIRTATERATDSVLETMLEDLTELMTKVDILKGIVGEKLRYYVGQRRTLQHFSTANNQGPARLTEQAIRLVDDHPPQLDVDHV
jgi:hypothetical protein